MQFRAELGPLREPRLLGGGHARDFFHGHVGRGHGPAPTMARFMVSFDRPVYLTVNHRSRAELAPTALPMADLLAAVLQKFQSH